MYCKKCGHRINIEDNKCIECGMQIRGIEYNGGFWGMVGDVKEDKRLEPLETKMNGNGSNPSKSKKYKRTIKRLILLIVVLLGISLLQTVYIVKLSKSYAEILTSYEELGIDDQQINDD